MSLRSLIAAGAILVSLALPAAAQQTLKVGSTPTGIPFTFLDTQTNTIQGVMVDLITEIGKDAGFGVQVEPMQFSALIGSLTSNRIDIIAAAMYITEPRKQQIDFSAPVYTYGDGLFVPKSDVKEYASLQDLKGLTVGVQVGTAYVEPLQKSGLFPEVKIYDSIPDIMRDVNTGRLKAGFADLPIVVGRWGESGGGASVAERLTGVGATHVLFTLADARDRILKTVLPQSEVASVGVSTVSTR